MATPILAPKGFVRTSIPILEGGDGQYLQSELANIATSIATMLIFIPAVATKPPTSLGDGMIRLSRAPWQPLTGQSGDAWVQYNAATQTWVAFP